MGRTYEEMLMLCDAVTQAIRSDLRQRGRDFSDLPFVLIKKGNRTRSIVDQCFARHNFSPKLILETENTVTTLAMAQSGIGITICPELFLLAMPAGTGGTRDVDIFPLTDPATASNLVAGYRPDRYLSHFGERFIELAQECF